MFTQALYKPVPRFWNEDHNQGWKYSEERRHAVFVKNGDTLDHVHVRDGDVERYVQDRMASAPWIYSTGDNVVRLQPRMQMAA